MSKDWSRWAARTEGKAEVTTWPMRSTTDEKVSSRVYWASDFSSYRVFSDSGVKTLSNKLRDMTAKGVLAANRSKTCPSRMADLLALLTYLVSPCTVIAKTVPPWKT